MLAIRMQRVGRKGHAQFRLVVQESRFSPKSGRVVAYLGSYNPHAKKAILDKTKLEQYLGNGAHPSERVIKLLTAEGIKLPSWVKPSTQKSRSIRQVDKLRRNRPAEVVAETPVEETPPAETESQPETDAEATAPAEPAEAPIEAEPQETAPEEPAAPAES